VVFTTHSGTTLIKHKYILTMTAALVKFSEHIIVFEAGGKLAFAGRPEDWFKEKRDRTNINLPEEEPVKNTNGGTNGEKPAAEANEDENERTRRQAGDATLWTYYLKAVGTTNLMIVVGLQLFTVTGQNFPRKLIHSPKTVAETQIHLRQIVDKFQHVTIS
jgi:hypothetical protein